MKKLAFVSAVVLSLLTSGSPVFAESKAQKSGLSGVKVAFIDMQQAILQTEEGKIAKTKIEKEAESKKKDLERQQDELKKMNDEFLKQQSVLSDEAKGTKQKDFQIKVQALQNAQMAFQQEVREKEQAETGKIFRNLSGVIDEIAKKKGYDLVFERGAGALLYASKIDDITTDVVASYNSRFKVTK